MITEMCGGHPRQMKDGALHERSTSLLGGMLIQRHDIGTRVSQEGADRRHQPGRSAQRSSSRPHVVDRQCRAADWIR
jgi:hypothetical protein